MICKKLELNQETLKNLIHEPEGLSGERARIAATFPPVCEHTNFISCLRC